MENDYDVTELIKKSWWTEGDVSRYTGRAVSTLRNERFLRRGFPYYQIGRRSIRYKAAEIMAAMEARRVSFEADGR
jgi:hypothetical protein